MSYLHALSGREQPDDDYCTAELSVTMADSYGNTLANVVLLGLREQRQDHEPGDVFWRLSCYCGGDVHSVDTHFEGPRERLAELAVWWLEQFAPSWEVAP